LRDTPKSKDMNLVELNSVGSIVDIDEKIVYPQLQNGLPDLDCGVSLVEDEISGDWFDMLSEKDSEIVKELVEYL
jgi:hypothetical protein